MNNSSAGQVTAGRDGVKTGLDVCVAETAQQNLFYIIGDRIKGLKLRRVDAYCGGVAVHEAPQYIREKKSLSCTAARVLWQQYIKSLVYCCSSTAAIAAKYIRSGNMYL